MVRIFVLSEYSSDPPEVLGDERTKICGGPLYDLGRIQAIVSDETKIQQWTEKCRKDIVKWFDSDTDQVIDLIAQLRESDYVDSEWCTNGRGAVAACDAYKVERFEVVPRMNKPVRVEYYLKFAVGKTGALVLLVSCHS